MAQERPPGGKPLWPDTATANMQPRRADLEKRNMAAPGRRDMAEAAAQEGTHPPTDAEMVKLRPDPQGTLGGYARNSKAQVAPDAIGRAPTPRTVMLALTLEQVRLINMLAHDKHTVLQAQLQDYVDTSALRSIDNATAQILKDAGEWD